MRQEPVAVVVAAPARAVPTVRELLDALGPPHVRSTAVERLADPVESIVERARSATPSRGVVVVVATEADADAAIAAGADEVLVEPLSADAFARAIRRASLRSGVRDLAAIEARMLEQVVWGVAHAVEGPLAALALDVDALRSGALSTPDGTVDEIDAALDECSTAVEHVAHVVRDATVLATRPPRERADAFALPPLIDHVLRALGGGAALRAHVEVQHEIGLPPISAPRRLLARTTAQLLLQALDAVPDDDAAAMRRLRVTLRSTVDAVVLVIEVRAGLDSPPPSSRVGLDLDGRLGVVRAALRSFDGELVAERATDAEARFVAFLPRVDPVAVAGRTESSSLGAPRRPRPRVLVVDRDERVLRASVRSLAERFDVVVAITGEEALSVAREASVDVALVDVRLPDMSALALVDELQRVVPALAGRVALVGGGDEIAVPNGAPILAKPVRRTALLAALDALLGAPAQSAPLPDRVLN